MIDQQTRVVLGQVAVDTAEAGKGSGINRFTPLIDTLTGTDLHGPDELAAWIRGHRQIENGLHWVRDVTFTEDASHVRTGAAPQVMATLRNLVISLHRLEGATNIARALRHHSRNPLRPLQLLKIN